ncbi:AAA family ATPase [Shewanella sp. Choline-02u-19]|jgi:MoxR-like ATPase|uniref:AAA family ATPase n=1 Tax=unclassified Shewanella TaxID=196818 RepID=UPI000C32C7EA|nr:MULTISPECIES: MoxR family ATPase [unclassified Shewanella]PKG55534.1 AAA family ATPase [Shewanella sp. GutDb-MelDb]PKG76302.1 AAA family ATPase [Shewanella sp. GutCb]PKH57417.1 AAA family ATPase [Shewanella sp. Bg11-22]PKI28282.1 AAA family ATPase [Shewanella sp. Choline-02u-19]
MESQAVYSQLSDLQIALEKQVLGQAHVVRGLVLALLADGHVLLEGLPGTAKTRSVKTLADLLHLSQGRVQFTPDLLPSDVIGYEALSSSDNNHIDFNPGPIFNHILLADEINRAPPKVQSALLEAMEERQVTIGNTSHPMESVFLVLATQNPIEQEGTYPLPEAQMDRFLFKIVIDYPEDETELAIIRLTRGQEVRTDSPPIKIENAEVLIMQARSLVHDVFMSESIEKYIVALVMGTRKPERYPDSELQKYIKIGASPRASIALDKASRAHAVLEGRDYVDPDDVRAVVMAVLSHRIMLSYAAVANGKSAQDVVKELVSVTPIL